MQKLNLMGQAIKQPANNNKQSSNNAKSSNNPLQVVRVTYGHNGSGKLYDYYGQNKRAGDIVTPYVTNKKTGKTYKTLGVVRSTRLASSAETGVAAEDMKTLGVTDQRSLPNYYKGWDKDAQAAYDLKKEVQLNEKIPKMEKLNLFGKILQMREEDKQNRGGKR